MRPTRHRLWLVAQVTLLVVVSGVSSCATAKPEPVRERLAVDANGHFLVHGTPRFPLGVYDSGLSYWYDTGEYERNIFDPRGPRGLADFPISLYLNMHYGALPVRGAEALLDVLDRHGVMYIHTTNSVEDRPWSRANFMTEQKGYVEQLARHRAMAGYYVIDEPKESVHDTSAEHHRALKARDPRAMNFGALLAAGYVDPKLWTDTVDFFGPAPFVIWNAEPPPGWPHFLVAEYTARAAATGTPTVPVLQFNSAGGHFPTRAHLRSHAVMAIVEGARGIIWWAFGTQDGALNNGRPQEEIAAHKADLRATMKEIAALEPVLLAPDAPSALAGNSTTTGRDAQLARSVENAPLDNAKQYLRSLIGHPDRDPLAKNAADVRTKVKVVGGKGYVFAYNYTNQPRRVRLTWHAAPSSVVENSDQRSFELSGSSWNDSLGPYEARIYVVTPG
jgi:hypothetical protein